MGHLITVLTHFKLIKTNLSYQYNSRLAFAQDVVYIYVMSHDLLQDLVLHYEIMGLIQGKSLG